jgi:REP element-mobilizing transposase RayT
MHFEPDALYHIYNRSNETVFYSRENYLFFLKKVKSKVAPFCKILSWVLMPNHFHLLVVATVDGCKTVEENHRPSLQMLSKNIGIVLSSFTQAINKQENRRGKLFSNNTEAKCLNDIEFDNVLRNALSGSRPLSAYNCDYATICFNYIHQNPVIAGLVHKMEDWEFSSFRDFAGLRNGVLIDKDLAFEYVRFDKEDFYSQSQIILDDTILKKLF